MNSQRILLAGGLLLFLFSAGYGLLYDGFILVQQHNSLLYNLDMALNMAAKGDLAMASAFAASFGAAAADGNVHARISLHLAIAGAMTTVPLWISPKLVISERLKRIMALFIVFGGVMLASGDFLQVMGSARIGYYLVLAGYVWMMLGLLGYAFYAVLFIWIHEEEFKPKRG